MSNLDLRIAEIIHGDTEVLKIMKGDDLVWEENGEILPYNAEVEYLESDGTAIINTGIIPTLNYSVDMDIKWVAPINTTNDASLTPFGVYPAWHSKSFAPLIQAQNGTYAIYNCWGNSHTTKGGAKTYIEGLIGSWHNISFCYRQTYIDGIVTSGAVGQNTDQPDRECAIFCAKLVTTQNSTGVGTLKRIRAFKMYDDLNKLVRNYIPVRVGNVGYMYDKVSKQLFGNVNSIGAFTYGADVINKTYNIAKVKYLQSDGTAYIDTGIQINVDDIMTIIAEVEFVSLNTSDNNILFGCYETNKRLFIYVNSSGNWAHAYSSANNTNVTASVDTNYIVEYTFKSGGQTLIVNGKSIATGSSSNSIPTSTNIAFFGALFEETLISGSQYKLKRAYIIINNKLVGNYIPVKKNNTGYLYNKVTGALLGNANFTGAFIYGNDV